MRFAKVKDVSMMGVHRATLSAAAIEVLATEGGRAFTHRAVDRQAGLPQGTASRYARTRDALLALAADSLFDADIEVATRALSVGHSQARSPSQVLDVLMETVTTLLDAPQRYLARVELQLEARRAPELRRHLDQSRAAFVSGLATLLSPKDAGASADIAIAIIDGVLHRQLVLDQPPLTPGQLRAVLGAVISGHRA